MNCRAACGRAAGRRFPGEIRVGDAIVRRSTIASVKRKEGAQRPAGVRHGAARDRPRRRAACHHRRARHRLSRAEGAGGANRRDDGGRATGGARWCRTPSSLFRYSALTFNGHRIHYDRDYVTKEEGYPGLVVHGPLIATLLVDLVRRHAPQARIEDFRVPRRVAAVRRQRNERQCRSARRGRRREALGGQCGDGRLADDRRGDDSPRP